MVAMLSIVDTWYCVVLVMGFVMNVMLMLLDGICDGCDVDDADGWFGRSEIQGGST